MLLIDIVIILALSKQEGESPELKLFVFVLVFINNQIGRQLAELVNGFSLSLSYLLIADKLLSGVAVRIILIHVSS